MTTTVYTPNEIRRILNETQNWTRGLAEGNPEMFTEAYLGAIDQITDDRKQTLVIFQKRQTFLMRFTYTTGTIGVGSAIGAAILYAINLKNPVNGGVNFADKYAVASFILSVATGTFTFLAGCGKLISEYTRYETRAQKMSGDVRLLGILKRMIVGVRSEGQVSEYAQTTGNFARTECEIFGKFNVDEQV